MFLENEKEGVVGLSRDDPEVLSIIESIFELNDLNALFTE